jgi:hypothetical protein
MQAPGKLGHPNKWLPLPSLIPGYSPRVSSVRILYVMPNPIDELLNRPIPEKMWHYTSIQGFHGIVTSEQMFATDLRFLNDREEFVHARNIANQMVTESSEFDEEGFPNRKFLANAVTLAFESGPLTGMQLFVASFSASEDQLGQWRGYSHGSSGVSLAFDLRSFRPPAGNETLVSFAPCVYGPRKKKELIMYALRHLCLANCNFASHRTCHNVTSRRCMLFISKAVLILAKHSTTLP